MKHQIGMARPDEIEGLWPTVYPLMSGALDGDVFLDESRLKQRLASDKAMLLLVCRDKDIIGAAAVEIVEAKDNIVNILALGGRDFRAWKPAIDDFLNKYAYFMECKRIVANGRRGWARLWPEFKPQSVFYCREVTHA